jgi:hypothetical protein
MRASRYVRAALLWTAAALLLCCGYPLPSTTPLGRGPLAEPETEDELGARAAARPGPRAPSADAGSAEGDDATLEPDASQQAAADQEPPEATEPEDQDSDRGESSPAASEQPAAFAGEYLGNDVTTIRIDGMPERSAPDPQARIQVERQSDAEVKIVIIYTPTGDPFCTLEARVKGNVATITAGQTCPDQSGGSPFSGTVTSGTAKLSGRRLTVDLEADIEVEMGDERGTGKLVYHFEGERQ